MNCMASRARVSTTSRQKPGMRHKLSCVNTSVQKFWRARGESGEGGLAGCRPRLLELGLEREKAEEVLEGEDAEQAVAFGDHEAGNAGAAHQRQSLHGVGVGRHRVLGGGCIVERTEGLEVPILARQLTYL